LGGDIDPCIKTLCLHTKDDPSGALQARYLAIAHSAVYLIRPDQHIAARWPDFDRAAVHQAHRRALARKPETWS
jgi:3-(3-hydroxy-phenyl)propionate hydroxylase